MSSSNALRSNAKWGEALEEFRALGGAADNLTPGYGPLGRGLFPIDRDRPSRIYLPENLLIDVESSEFKNGRFHIKSDSAASKRERAFFEFFENELSWGGGGKDECALYLDHLKALPSSIKDFLSSELGLDFPDAAKSSDETVEERFINSRTIVYEKRDKLMPILELANHAVSGCTYNFKNGISIEGRFKTEILVHYGLYDSYGVFENWGFPCAEPLAFSMPAIINTGGREIVISRQFSTKAKRGKFRVPVVEQDGDRLNISYLLLGHRRFPRLSKGIFYQLMKDIGEPNAEDLFDEIRRFNIQKFLNLLEALDEHQGPMITALRQMCRHQISAITHSIGTRNIGC